MPTLVLKFGDNIRNRFAFDKTMVTIGRATDNDIVVDNLAVSRKHAQIEKMGDAYVLTDLRSANGTFVNGERVLRRPLKHFDTIAIGKHQVVFLEDAKAQPSMDEPISPFDFDRTIVVNPPADRSSSVLLIPPREERASIQDETPLPTRRQEMPTQMVRSTAGGQYVASTFSPIYHMVSCEWVQGIKVENQVYFVDKDEADRSGRRACRICMPVKKKNTEQPSGGNGSAHIETHELANT